MIQGTCEGQKHSYDTSLLTSDVVKALSTQIMYKMSPNC